jgi:hypothetical protein
MSKDLEILLEHPVASGEDVIGLSRAILAECANADIDLNEEIMSVFLSIDDQFDHVVLENHGRFNVASPRYYLKGNNHVGLGPLKEVLPGTPHYEEELSSAFRDFSLPFEESRNELRERLALGNEKL